MADQSDTMYPLTNDFLTDIDGIRAKLSEILADTKGLYQDMTTKGYSNPWIAVMMEEAVKQVLYARNWFGMTLAEIRDHADQHSTG